uniref:Uncharacterized protein n=1 Tax=Candidatus Kentrum sp. DK TaxID=2126562 RepID=A0A450TMS0_9GAMM|nr:MAG: hypothetical protein BECKDK2373C_GA0170839_12031 [Candidatus Kentron sp. DK]
MWGGGARVFREWRGNGDKCIFSMAPFAEYLTRENSPDGSKDRIPVDREQHNLRAGIGSWSELKGQGEYSDLWFEMWSEFAYNSTNFEKGTEKDYYLLNLNPYVGYKWDFGKSGISPYLSVQPYYRASFIRDFGKDTWNKMPWLNNISHGPGIRLSLENLINKHNMNFYLFVEHQNIEYPSRVEPSHYENNFDDDVSVGIRIWMPFGAIKDRRG